MKHSALYPIVAGLVLGGMLLTGTALAETKTPFTATETDKTQNFPWLPDASGTGFYMFGGSATFEMESEDSRVAGSGWYTIDAFMDSTGAITLWGKFHNENTDGAWDGYYTGTQDGFTATCVGSGAYEGLVSRWQWTPNSDGNGIYHWRGYIVENGPGEVPFKISGWRDEEVAPVGPFMVKATSFAAGGGRASHIGVFTDIMEIGFMDLSQGISRGTGSAQAANGDLFTWVSFGQMNSSGQFEFSVFFAGGTGRFEHAVGSYTGQLNWSSNSYQGTGTIRY